MRPVASIASVLAVVALLGCRGKPPEEPPIVKGTTPVTSLAPSEPVNSPVGPSRTFPLPSAAKKSVDLP